MASSSRANSFGTFLDTINKSSAPATPASPPPPAPSTSPGAPLILLSVLAKTPSRSVTALMSESGMDILSFTEALRGLKDAGFVTLAGDPANEAVELTESGKQLTGLPA